MTEGITFLLSPDILNEPETLGHALEMMGAISHDEYRAEKVGNEMCRRLLREAEAFAAGYLAGLKGVLEDAC